MFTLNDKIELTALLTPHFIVRVKYVLFPIKIKQKCMHISFLKYLKYILNFTKNLQYDELTHIKLKSFTVQDDIMNINRLYILLI